ncbi:hypothetical protein [Glycomyces buryatensis]|uniref:Uncharacterized protein n=1 Tax=Glycomyces buryatensis TaxID=2570927 RepID=A0A4S8PZ09_9ACTN|nr:hypothetical protein [Glycomyces buryatensis]THV35252.1 hypothetical protein FAB82_23640 [Glycomyces buryatensis]
MTSTEKHVRVMSERRAQLNLCALADLLVTASQTEPPTVEESGRARLSASNAPPSDADELATLH